jgi:hypothetical protein
MNRQALMIRLTVCMLAILLLPAYAPQASAQGVGRLFMTQQERMELERVRQGGKPKAPKEEVQSASVPHAQVSLDSSVTIDGYVQRTGSGKSTVWVNAQPQNEDERTQGLTLLSGKGKPGSVALQLPSGRNVKLKPGQSMDIATGQIREGYETGLVVSEIPPASAPRGQP